MAEELFAGLKILDFSWVAVGPFTIRYFADHGATVIHVESATHIDTLRTSSPFKDNTPYIDHSGFFANYNAGKYGITLNLNHPRGVEVAKRLVQWADVVAESFSPRALRKWGLAYDDLVKIKPDVILFSTCQQGQNGPYANYVGYGSQGAALAGIYHLTGWPDRPPAGPYGAYTDFVTYRVAVLSIAAAVDYRRRTGRGTHIDLSQVEAGIQFTAPTILDQSANGRTANRNGNRSPHHAPQGVFPCRGEDRWIAIAVTGDEEWQKLCRVLNRPDWGTDSRFANLPGRKEHENEIEEALALATKDREAYELMQALQEAGVPAGVVQKTSDLFADPQLTHRGHFAYHDHPAMGHCSYDNPAVRFSRTPGRTRSAAPCIGQHNEYVYKEILGLSEEEYVAGLIDGVFE